LTNTEKFANITSILAVLSIGRERRAQLDPKITPLVEVINALGVPTNWSCEGHGGNRNLIQSAYPLISIRPELSPKGIKDLARFLGMVGVHNDNCHMQEDVTWIVIPRGYVNMSFLPLQQYQSLEVLHAGIVTLVDHLQKMSARFTLEKLRNPL